MRCPTLLVSLLFVGLTASTAAADVHEPNGLLVPVDSSPEIQLYTLFKQRGEALDWHASAQVTPNAFSPGCGFTATYILNQAGSHFGLAWYNETGQAPAPGQLHQLVPPNSKVGTTFSGTAIKADPAYAGGLVGFALVGGQTHYTNSAYDVVCSNPFGCNPPGPWITALMYPSTVTPSAYYICFEDGSTNAFSFSNDGDFNDDVFFVTGISCMGGGQPCDTGKPGICGPGLTQCGPNGNTCQPLNQPAAVETCNGLDDNCNGTTDEGAICPMGQICDKGTCVKSCSGGEFPCLPGEVCSPDGHCVDPACASVTCPMGEVCFSGVCKGPCDGVVCPLGQVCRVGACVDPCASVKCGADQVCDNGACIGSCACLACPASKACDMKTGACVPPACVGVMCAAGTQCVGGVCVDACQGAMCPTGQACTAGQCVATMGAGSASSASGGAFAGAGGGPQFSGSGGAGGAGGHAGASGVGSGGAGGAGIGSAGGARGCGCRVTGVADTGGRGEVALAALALAVAVARRRRR